MLKQIKPTVNLQLGLCASWFVYNFLILNNITWSEYPEDSKTKNEYDQDIYYVCKETGKENYIDASNLKGEDYEQLLEDLGERIENKQVINVETIKKQSEKRIRLYCSIFYQQAFCLDTSVMIIKTSI